MECGGVGNEARFQQMRATSAMPFSQNAKLLPSDLWLDVVHAGPHDCVSAGALVAAGVCFSHTCSHLCPF